jgi:hypothetical protein
MMMTSSFVGVQVTARAPAPRAARGTVVTRAASAYAGA